jgi:hypothetical protein
LDPKYCTGAGSVEECEKDQFAPGEAFEMICDGDGKPTLAPKAAADLLPPEKVIKGLL